MDIQPQRFWLIVAAFVLAVPAATGQVAFAPVFGDHMVLQRERPITLTGSAPAGAEVRVTLGEEHTEVGTDSEGNWIAHFDPRGPDPAGLRISVVSGDWQATLTDVLIGDVWICAGQSNMEWPLARDAERDAAIADVGRPTLRLYQARYTATGAGGAWGPGTIKNLTKESFAPGQWTRCDADALLSMSAVGYYFGRALHDALEVPIGLVDLAAGGTPTEAWVSRKALAAGEQTAPMVSPGNWLENPLLGDWCRERATLNLSRAMQAGEPVPGDEIGPNHAFKPSFMWEAAVAPWTALEVCGVIWYQGESNAESPRRVGQHGELFPMLIHDWRQQWDNAQLPIYFVQLPAMGRPDWPEFREQQRLTAAAFDHVGMAVTIDVGHPTNVHPRNKRPVGERLARLALSGTYGVDLIASGPKIATVERRGREIRLLFTECGEGLAISGGESATGFELIQADGSYLPVNVSLEGHGVLIIGNEGTIGVRYAWAPVPECNLVNSGGIPASPFRIKFE